MGRHAVVRLFLRTLPPTVSSDGFAPAPAAGCEQPDHYKLTASSLSLTLKQKQIGCCQDKVGGRCLASRAVQ